MNFDVQAFVHDLNYCELPTDVARQARRCLVDLVGVTAAGTSTTLSRTMRDHVACHYAAKSQAAEYQAPRAPMMRCIDHPTMVKDSSAIGAHAGVTAGLLAREGFTGAPAMLVHDLSAGGLDVWQDLGVRWRILEQYTKVHPICRWAQPAVQAVIDLLEEHEVDAGEITEITVTTFHEATKLHSHAPADTEQAQYSLPFPVAATAVHGELPVELITRPVTAGNRVRQLAADMRIVESVAMTEQFPRKRLADVSIAMVDGRCLRSGPTEPVGDPEEPLTDRELEAKFFRYSGSVTGPARARRLLEVLSACEGYTVTELLDEMVTDD